MIPLVMNAAPIDLNEKQKPSNEKKFIEKTTILPQNNKKSNSNEPKVNGLKKLIQNIHDSTTQKIMICIIH